MECVFCAIKSEIESVRNEIMNLEDAIPCIMTRRHGVRNSETVDDKDTSNISELQRELPMQCMNIMMIEANKNTTRSIQTSSPSIITL